jgi:hypothetical protein
MSSNAAFTILANQSYLVEGEVYSTVYGSLYVTVVPPSNSV